MKHTTAVVSATLALTLGAAGMTFAQGSPAIYGSQLMSNQERIEFRNKMRALKTQDERDALRLEHHQQMQQRAQNMGITLPDAPPAAGGGVNRNGGGGRGRPQQ